MAWAGKDGKVIFVRHGGVFVRVSPNRLHKVNNISFSNDHKITDTYDPNMPESNQSNSKECDVKDSDTKAVSESVLNKEVTEIELDVPRGELPAADDKLSANDKIQFRLPDSEDWVTAIVLGRAGKVSGKNRNWYNIRESESNVEKSLNLDVAEWKKINDSSEDVNITGDELDIKEVNKAKQSELEKLKTFNTYEEVVDNGQNTLSTRWVITNKEGSIKARLVVREFEEEYYVSKDSPTVSKGSMRIFLSISSSKNWTVKTTDIKSAYLQGKRLDRDVFLRPPKESETPDDIIWKLHHCLYGLKDGARQFFLSVKEEMHTLGFQQQKLDPAVFILRNGMELCGMICCHVDDFLHAGNETFERNMVKFRQRFSAGKIEEQDFKYIGFQIRQDSYGIVVDHSGYMNSLENFTIEPKRASMKNESLSVPEQTLYRRLIGQLNWAVQGSRPDMAFQMVDLSTKLKKATVGDLLRAIKAINRLKEFKSEIYFPSLDEQFRNCRVLVFSDASLANICDGQGSTGAHIVLIVNSDGKCCPLAWQANKIKRIVRSTIAAEALSLQAGLESGIYHRKMIEEVLNLPENSVPIYAYTDNKSVIEALNSTKLVDDKRLRIDIAAISQSLEFSEVVKVKWCEGNSMIADCMTKQGTNGVKLLNVLQSGKIDKEFLCV